MTDNHTSARGIMGLMQPKGPPEQPEGHRLRQVTYLILTAKSRSAMRTASSFGKRSSSPLPSASGSVNDNELLKVS